MRIAGAGHGCVDLLYSPVDFGSETFQRLRTHRPGDGGLVPGHLVFVEEFEAFTGRPVGETLRTLTGREHPNTLNIGGPCIVSLILAAQVLRAHDCGDAKVEFHGVRGNDEEGPQIYERASRTPLDVTHYRVLESSTPYTIVLSDPTFDGGHGERCFVNGIGAGWDFCPSHIPDSFFDAEIAAFGGTALVPGIHDHLGALLRKAKQRGAVTVVNTVFDFRGEKARPGQRWLLGEDEDEETYRNVDLLLVDKEEALRLSGTSTLEQACAYFQARGAASFAITQGPLPVTFWSDGRLFERRDLTTLPVCGGVREWMEAHPEARGDTTGCGDNFAGAMFASLATQMMAGRGRGSLDMARAIAASICAGGCACFHVGGVLTEKAPGEKKALIEAMYAKYRLQVAGQCELPELPF
jgi:sugar/nucleoside kinase (ribokinase family)